MVMKDPKLKSASAVDARDPGDVAWKGPVHSAFGLAGSQNVQEEHQPFGEAEEGVPSL